MGYLLLISLIHTASALFRLIFEAPEGETSYVGPNRQNCFVRVDFYRHSSLELLDDG
jgi:hypothetical protein